MELSNSKIRKFLKLFGLSPQNFSPQNFCFFLKRPALKKFFIFSQKKLFLFSGNGTFLFFLKKGFFYISGKIYSKLGTFRTTSIFRTLVYSEPEAYSEHCQTSTIERFAKIAT